jgi:2-polyprenyl-6-methoxyphenol hydroxylase-like FAD-dependent oxidoreductase
MMPGRAIVVGAGIGGLAAAIALGAAGWQVLVLEQAAVFWEAGAGLVVTPNGLRALAGLGVETAVRSAGAAVEAAGIMASDGRWLRRLTGPQRFEAVSVHRRALHGILLDAVGEVADLRPGARVLSIRPGVVDAGPAAVTWREGTGDHSREADLVVAADGLASLARRRVDPTARLRDSGLVAWRAVVEGASPGGGDGVLWWGPGVEAGLLPIGRGRVSWHWLERRDARGTGERPSVTGTLALMPRELREAVAATPAGAMIRHDLRELASPLRSFHAGRVVLVGDAAHAILPTIGQGANLALEDAAHLADALRHGELHGALASFDRARVPRARAVARLARRAAVLGAGWPPAASGLRDLLVARLPSASLTRSVALVTGRSLRPAR